ATAVAEIGVHLVQPGEMKPEPLQRGKRPVPQILAARIVSRITLDDFGAERLLAREMIVEGARRRARGLGDVPHAAGVEPLVKQGFESCLHDLFANVLTGHSTPIRATVLNQYERSS